MRWYLQKYSHIIVQWMTSCHGKHIYDYDQLVFLVGGGGLVFKRKKYPEIKKKTRNGT